VTVIDMIRKTAVLLAALALARCAPPDVVGQQVGRSLYDASVDTGRALSTAGQRTGEVLQDAGANISNAFSPPPPAAYPGYDALPPAYPGYDAQPAVPGSYDAPAPITAAPLPPPDAPGTPANPAVGY
jgi:hypothetical protein